MNGESSCPDQQVLYAFLLGQMAGPDLEQVGNHLEACSRCIERIQALSIHDPVLDAARDMVACLPKKQRAPLVRRPSRRRKTRLRRPPSGGFANRVAHAGPLGVHGEGERAGQLGEGLRRQFEFAVGPAIAPLGRVSAAFEEQPGIRPE